MVLNSSPTCEAAAPNPRLQRTRAALLRQSLSGESASFGGARRAPLSRQPLGRLRPAALSVLLVAVGGCASTPDISNPRMSAPAGALELEYAAAHPEPEPWGDPTALNCRDLDAKTGVTEISLERSGCFGFCSMYTVTLRADGTASFEGKGNVKFVGHYVGTLDQRAFEALARFSEEIGFLDKLPSRQYCAVTDNPTVYVLVAKAGERRVIKHYAPDRDGPATLWWFEQAIDVVQDGITWKKAP